VVVLNEHGGHGGAEAAPTAAAVVQKYFDLKKADAELAAQPVLPAAVPPPTPTFTEEPRRSVAAVPPEPR
jgi:penicillin-binding protein 2